MILLVKDNSYVRPLWPCDVTRLISLRQSAKKPICPSSPPLVGITFPPKSVDPISSREMESKGDRRDIHQDSKLRPLYYHDKLCFELPYLGKRETIIVSKPVFTLKPVFLPPIDLYRVISTYNTN